MSAEKWVLHYNEAVVDSVTCQHQFELTWVIWEGWHVQYRQVCLEVVHPSNHTGQIHLLQSHSAALSEVFHVWQAWSLTGLLWFSCICSFSIQLLHFVKHTLKKVSIFSLAKPVYCFNESEWSLSLIYNLQLWFITKSESCCVIHAFKTLCY